MYYGAVIVLYTIRDERSKELPFGVYKIAHTINSNLCSKKKKLTREIRVKEGGTIALCDGSSTNCLYSAYRNAAELINVQEPMTE